MSEPTCRTCGSALVAGATRCPTCGAPTLAANRTIVGMAPAAPQSPPQSLPQSTPPPPSSGAPVSAARVVSVSGAGAPAASRPVPGTMIGVRFDSLPQPPAGQPGSAPAGNRTMLGVALPGIAPTHEKPGNPSPPTPAFVPPPPPPSTSQPIVPAPFVPRMEERGDAPIDPSATRPARARSPLAAILVASLAAAVIVVVLLLWRRTKPPPRLVVERHEGATADDLIVKCEACGDDGEIVNDDRHARFSKGEAKLSLPHDALKPGKNAIVTTLTTGGRSWPITLEVVVPYLARASLDRLGKDGVVELVLDVASNVESVKVGDATTKPTDGRVVVPVPIAPTKDDAAKTFATTVAFEVKTSSGEPREGSLTLSFPYVTLKVAGAHDLSAHTLVVAAVSDAAKIGGRASPNAHVVCGDAVLDADSSGKFQGEIKVAQNAATIPIVGYASGAAPRAIDLSLLRVSSIDDAWKQIRARSKTASTKVLSDPDAFVGEWVDVTIAVKDAKEEDGRVVVVGDVRCASGDAGCPPVRALLPAGFVASKGDVVRAGGVVTRSISIDKGKSKAAEVEAIVAAPSK